MPTWSASSGPAPTLQQLLVETGHRLEICCCWHACRRRVFWSPEVAIRKLGATCTMDEAVQRLTCAACGHRGRDREVTCRPSMEDFYDQRWAAKQAERKTPPGGAEGR